MNKIAKSLVKSILLIAVALSLFLSMFEAAVAAPDLSKITLPPGFSISIYADNVPNARQMTLGDDGVVYVGSRMAGNVYALIPNKDRTKAQQVKIIAKDLWLPNGVAYHNGDLYIAEVSRISKIKDVAKHLNQVNKPVIINKSLPDKIHHGWKYIKFSPDGWLYVPVGAPCNVCLKKDKRFASIMRMKPDGSDLQIYAEGIRNSVGFDWDPKTKQLWFTCNGRDWLGDDLPPDELNFAPKPGMHFGFPFFYGNNQPDPKYGKGKDPKGFIPAAYELGPHVAALGMIFYTAKMFPEKYQNSIFIAEHGSWNRSQKIGYRVTWIKMSNNKPVSYKDFATGWLQDQRVLGRPVDVLQMVDGSLLVSDDMQGIIYRISYKS